MTVSLTKEQFVYPTDGSAGACHFEVSFLTSGRLLLWSYNFPSKERPTVR
jgi:hypothetical protein